MKPYDNQRKHGAWASRFLDTVGDGTGSIEANVDGSGAPVDFNYTVPEGHILLVDRLVVWIEDNGSFDAGLYGNGLALANGIMAGRTINGTFEPRTTQLPIRANADWPAYSFDFDYIDIGQGPNVAVARYSYIKDGAPIVYTENTKYTMRIQDDLSNLVGHRFRLGAVLCKQSG